eukprot:302568-Amphidinium_carterae.2
MLLVSPLGACPCLALKRRTLRTFDTRAGTFHGETAPDNVNLEPKNVTVCGVVARALASYDRHVELVSSICLRHLAVTLQVERGQEASVRTFLWCRKLV